MQTATALSKRWEIDRRLAAAKVTLEEQKAELAANESKTTHLANHDSLTDAPNRLAFMRTLTEYVRGLDTFAMAILLVVMAVLSLMVVRFVLRLINCIMCAMRSIRSAPC